MFFRVQRKKRRRSRLRRGFLMVQSKKQASKLFHLIIYGSLYKMAYKSHGLSSVAAEDRPFSGCAQYGRNLIGESP